MQTPSDYNVVIFLNSTFYQPKIDQLIEPFTNGQEVIVYLFYIESQEKIDLSTWKSKDNFKIIEVISEFTPPTLNEETIVIDALFGFELNKPLTGGFAAVVRLINSSQATVVSIGAPSGLLPTDNTLNNAAHIVKANYTLLLDKAPLACYFNENQIFLGNWSVVAENDKESESEHPQFTSEESIAELIKLRRRFSHKGTYGHGLLIAGSAGMAGACSLAAKAALKSGLGLLTIHAPSCNRIIHQVDTPEAMVECDIHEEVFSESIVDQTLYQAIAIGPGLGVAEESHYAFQHLIVDNNQHKVPLIIDADAINILASNTHLLYNAIEGAILTPHPVELERLIGKCNNSYIRLNKAIELAIKAKVYIILKGAYSFLIKPDGSYLMTAFGNAGMATAGSGDILTGILLSLITQGYSKMEALIIGTYIHGKAGDLAAEQVGEISLTASDIIKYLPQAWLNLSRIAMNQ